MMRIKQPRARVLDRPLRWFAPAVFLLLLLGGVRPGLSAPPAEGGASVKGVASKAVVTPPRFLTELAGSPRVARLQDGTLLAISTRSERGTYELVARASRDNSKTWGDTEVLTPLPKAEAGWTGAEPLVDSDGELHIFFLQGRKKVPSGLDIDIHHMRSSRGRTEWGPLRRIWEGYTGSLNGVIQMKSGRIVLPFSYMTSRTWAKRGEGFDAFTYNGTFDCTVLYSDDRGATWRQSSTPLRVTAPDLGTYGAIEPVVVERGDGRVWMLLRTQHGRFYESFSEDGATWSRPKPSHLLSSDSPAGLVRISDGRIVLLWNNCLRFPYAYGGRHVLHGAISADNGETWRGFREIARNPRRHEPPPPSGDHGATYPIPCAIGDNKVITSTGLPSPHFNLFLDPEWLLETSRMEDFRAGLEEWSVFGVKGVGLVPHPLEAGREVLSIRKAEADWPAAAVWNFPAGIRGRLRLRLMLKPGFAGARIGITDHFSVPFDDLDEFANLYNLSIAPNGSIAAGAGLPVGEWADLEFDWDGDERHCIVSINGRRATVLRQGRDSLGANYIRLVSTATTTNDAGMLLGHVEVDVKPR